MKLKQNSFSQNEFWLF